MHARPLPLRLLLAGLALAGALPALALDGDLPPPPPEALPWAAPPRPEAPPRPRARAPQPVYPPAQVPDGYRARDARHLPPGDGWDGAPAAPWGAPRPFMPHLEVALRGGVATPGGDALPGLPLADLLGDQLVLGLEVGVRSSPHLSVGAFAEGGLGTAGPGFTAACAPGAWRCDASSASGRLGVGLRWHLAPWSPLDPWLGYGVAVSGVRLSGEDSLGTFTRTLTGVEYAKLSAGADLQLGRGAAVGLYAEWTSGLYTGLEDREDGRLVASGGTDGATAHSWFTIGPRVRF